MPFGDFSSVLRLDGQLLAGVSLVEGHLDVYITALLVVVAAAMIGGVAIVGTVGASRG
jgi:hypothetical protein